MDFQTSSGLVGVEIQHIAVAGWTGRNRAAVDHHIHELAEIGIKPPSDVPLFYRVSNALLTQGASIEVLGEGSSGEAEPLLIRAEGRLFLGLASDHTDRDLEAYSVAYSKQACVKPVASTLWDFDEVSTHLDQIELRSWLWKNDAWQLYQDGALAMILPLPKLVDAAGMVDNSAMLCGTLPAIGGIQGSVKFKMELNDPVLNRRISHSYDVKTLPIIA